MATVTLTLEDLADGTLGLTSSDDKKLETIMEYIKQNRSYPLGISFAEAMAVEAVCSIEQSIFNMQQQKTKGQGLQSPDEFPDAACFDGGMTYAPEED